MAKEARGMFERNVSVLGKVVLKLFMCKDGGFLESIHPKSDFQIGITFTVKVSGSELIFVNDFLRNVSVVNAHVLKDLHERLKKKSLMLHMQKRAPCLALEITLLMWIFASVMLTAGEQTF